MRNAAGVGLGGFRAVLSFFIHVGVASILVASPFVVDNWYSQKHAPRYEPVVEIHDEANALDVDDLEADLKEVRFRKKTYLAVLTVPGQNVVNLNAEVLKYAETQMAGSPWISKDNPNYWRDGLLILAVRISKFRKSRRPIFRIQQRITSAPRIGMAVSSRWRSEVLILLRTATPRKGLSSC